MFEPNPEWSTFPWHHWNSPTERFMVLPSFVIGEFYFIFLAVVTLLHALSHGRTHTFVWAASLCAGTANDAFFMVLPIVDNFWQSQACIMLTPRMPLYIPCVYVVFMYSSTVACWRLGLPLLSTVCLTGLMGEMIYAPYDITGIKFLWWTWHDTDAPIRHRLLGVPIGSSVWVITFTACFQFWVTLTIKTKTSWWRQLVGLVLTSLLSTPLMMVQMALVQAVSLDSQGLPSLNSLLAVLLIYSAVISFSWSSRRLEPSSSLTSWLLLISLEWYFLLLVANMFSSDPTQHLSTGVHQQLGDCARREADLAGHMRQVFLCRETHSQDWSLDCDELCSQNMFGDCDLQTDSWYTVCGQCLSLVFLRLIRLITGKPFTNYPLHVTAIGILAALGSFTYSYALRDREIRKKTE